MNPNNSQPRACTEIRDYIDGTLRADVYLAVKWEWFVGYLSRYSEDDVKACLTHLGVELRDGVVFLWAGEYYSRLVEALVDMVRREGDASAVAELYREGAL
jgi:transposase-like protein